MCMYKQFGAKHGMVNHLISSLQSEAHLTSGIFSITGGDQPLKSEYRFRTMTYLGTYSLEGAKSGEIGLQICKSPLEVMCLQAELSK